MTTNLLNAVSDAAISPILTTAGTVTAATNSTDPATSLAPLQLPGSIYVTTVGAASFAATPRSSFFIAPRSVTRRVVKRIPRSPGD